MKTINNSTGKPNYSQRLNPDDPTTPWNETLETCNVTASVTALGCAGYDLVKLNKGLHTRPPMDLLYFMRKNERCNSLYDMLDPKHVTPMNEFMDVLAVAIEEYIGYDKDVREGKSTLTAKDIQLIYAAPMHVIHDHVRGGDGVVTHGEFTFTRKDGSTLQSGHYQALVGYNYDDNEIPDDVESWIMDDPFGDPNTKYVSENGNDVVLTMEQVNALIKPVNQAGGKDAIFIPKFTA